MNLLFARGAKALAWWAAQLLIGQFTAQALTPAHIARVKNLIVELADQAIDKSVKHQAAAGLIRELAEGLTDTVVDWVVRTLLWVARLVGDIQPEQEQQA